VQSGRPNHCNIGRVDVLVNNAGISWGGPPETMPLDKWRQVLDVNLTGAFLFAQAVARDMLPRGDGRIINVASIAGLFSLVNGPHYAAYAASKAGLIGLTRELAASWGRQGIRVNAIAPGFFHSRLADPVLPLVEPDIRRESLAAHRGRWRIERRRRLLRVRCVELHITGQVLAIDGGWSAT
jgi:gluconate 5-dehydrogenase